MIHPVYVKLLEQFTRTFVVFRSKLAEANYKSIKIIKNTFQMLMKRVVNEAFCSCKTIFFRDDVNI